MLTYLIDRPPLSVCIITQWEDKDVRVHHGRAGTEAVCATGPVPLRLSAYGSVSGISLRCDFLDELMANWIIPPRQIQQPTTLRYLNGASFFFFLSFFSLIPGLIVRFCV